MQQEEKADFLITLVGTSAMPNLIGIVSRIKENGEVFFIHSNETENISNNLEGFIEKKNNSDKTGKLKIKSSSYKIESYDNPAEVYRELSRNFYCIYEEIKKSNITDPVIEINYTGGTKVISSLSCTIFKEMFGHDFLNLCYTYLDGEKNKIHIYKEKEKKELVFDYSSKNNYIPLTVVDVVRIHFDSFSRITSGYDFKQSKFSKDMFNYIIKNGSVTTKS